MSRARNVAPSPSRPAPPASVAWQRPPAVARDVLAPAVSRLQGGREIALAQPADVTPGYVLHPELTAADDLTRKIPFYEKWSPKVLFQIVLLHRAVLVAELHLGSGRA